MELEKNGEVVFLTNQGTIDAFISSGWTIVQPQTKKPSEVETPAKAEESTEVKKSAKKRAK